MFGLASSQSGDNSSSDDDEEPQAYAPPKRTPTAPALSATLSGSRDSYMDGKEDSDASSTSSSLSLGAGGRMPRSPEVKALAPSSLRPSLQKRASSPIPSVRVKSNIFIPPARYLLPNTFCVTIPFPWGKRTLKASGDVRKAGENLILLGSLLFAIKRIWVGPDKDNWVALGELV